MAENDNMGKNAEGYSDPTVGEAWRRIKEKERQKVTLSVA